MKKVLLWIWQFPQHVFALCVISFIWYSVITHKKDNHIIVISDQLMGGMSLGNYIFMPRENDKMLKHELGHSKQSLLFGPLYLLIIGIPSLIHNIIHRYFRGSKYEWDYYSFYTEKFLMS